MVCGKLCSSQLAIISSQNTSYRNHLKVASVPYARYMGDISSAIKISTSIFIKREAVN